MRRPEVPQRQDEERQAHAVAEEADHEAAEEGTGRGERCTLCEREEEVDRSGDETLCHRDLHRVGDRELAGQVVVDAPAQARPGDEERAPTRAYSSACPGEDGGARKDHHRAREDPPIDVLAEHEPGDRERGEAFEVEEQGGGRRPGAGEPEHQQHGSEDAAEENDRREPGQVRAPERRFPAPLSPAAQPRLHEREPEASAEVEDAGKEPGLDRAEEELGQGRARAEEHGGGEGERHPGEAVHGRHGIILPPPADLVMPAERPFALPVARLRGFPFGRDGRAAMILFAHCRC